MTVGWEHYGELEKLVKERKSDEALASISARRQEFEASGLPIFLIEARAHRAKGNRDRAIAILLSSIGHGRNDFWAHYNLAECYFDGGDIEKTYEHYRQAHVAQGWTTSAKNQYRFTHDYFSHCIPLWAKWFDEHITKQPLRCLEIGSWQGESAAWLLDNVVSKRGGSLVCVDTFEGSPEQAQYIGFLEWPVEEYFDYNVGRTGHGAMCRKLKGLSQRVLPTLFGETFDFVYIDGAHEAKYVIQDAVLSWAVLEKDGFLLFDDVPYHFADAPHQNTKRAIDFFLSVFEDEIAIVEHGRQLLLRRISR